MKKKIDKKEEKRHVQQIHRILDLAMNTKKDHVFVWYSPHVNKISFDVHIGGWQKDTYPDISFKHYFGGNYIGNSLDEIEKELMKLE